MRREVKLVSAKLTALIHATEDTKKISRAIDQVCPADMFEQESDTRKLKGHYGNEITTMTVSLRKRTAGPFLQHLLELLSMDERVALIRDLHNRISEDGHLYLRLDKQECLQGKFHFRDQDPIKCELSFEIENSNLTAAGDQIKRFLSSIIDPAGNTEE